MAQVVRIAPEIPANYAEAVDRYLGAAGVADSSRRVYRISLTTWAWLLAGERPPGRRRCARPPDVPLAVLDDAGLPGRLATSFAARAAGADADTVNRELSVLRAAVSWWQAQGWIAADPSRGLSRMPAPPDRTRALSRAEVDAVFRLDVALREKTYWRLLYESAARADEVLTLDVGDLDLRNKRARVVAKGGAVEWIHWQSGTAQLLPRLLRGRQAGPVFLTDRRAPARTPAPDVCPITGRARLSYRRAAELFTEATRDLDPAGAGWTLHQLRHSDLTHEAEEGASTPMLLARSRHASVRSLERYARPGVDAVGAYVARRDPAARRRHAGFRPGA
jgi:integrase/recombinase XerD